MFQKVIHFLEHLDRRWVFLTIAVAVAIPLLLQTVAPEKATKLVQDIFDHIEGLPRGSKILLSFDYDPGSEPELQPMATAVARHCAEKGHKMYFIALWPVGPAMIEQTVDEVIRVTPRKILSEGARQLETKRAELEGVVVTVLEKGRGALSDEDRKAYDRIVDEILPKSVEVGIDKLSEEETALLGRLPNLGIDVFQAGLELLSEEEKRLLTGLAACGLASVNILNSSEEIPEPIPDVFSKGLEKFAKILGGDAQELKDLVERIEKGVRDLSHPDLVYGVDYLNLGFKPGNEGVIKVIVTDLKKLYLTDHYGTNIDEIPMMKEVNSVQDVDLIMNISAGYPGTKEWVQYAAEPYDKKIAAGCTGVQAPLLYPYIPKPLFGLMGAIKGAAEYEAALWEKYPKFEDPRLNQGVKRMGPQMVAHLAILLLIVIGNITYFATRKGRRSGGS